MTTLSGAVVSFVYFDISVPMRLRKVVAVVVLLLLCWCCCCYSLVVVFSSLSSLSYAVFLRQCLLATPLFGYGPLSFSFAYCNSHAHTVIVPSFAAFAF